MQQQVYTYLYNNNNHTNTSQQQLLLYCLMLIIIFSWGYSRSKREAPRDEQGGAEPATSNPHENGLEERECLGPLEAEALSRAI